MPEITKKDLIAKSVKLVAETFEPSFTAQRRPYTYVHYDVEFRGAHYHADGFSKVCWPDQWDEATGSYYACQKAVRYIVRKITNNYKRNKLVELIDTLETDMVQKLLDNPPSENPMDNYGPGQFASGKERGGNPLGV